MTRTILLPALLMSVFLAAVNADAACREGSKFIAKPQPDGSVLIVDECQPAAPSRRNTPAPRQETKTPPQPAPAENPKQEAKTPPQPAPAEKLTLGSAPYGQPEIVAQKII